MAEQNIGGSPPYIIFRRYYMYSNELFHFLSEEVVPALAGFSIPLGISFLINSLCRFIDSLTNISHKEVN